MDLWICLSWWRNATGPSQCQHFQGGKCTPAFLLLLGPGLGKPMANPQLKGMGMKGQTQHFQKTVWTSLILFFLGSQERSERCCKELIQPLFAGKSCWCSLLERDKVNSTPLSPSSIPNLLKELPLFPLEDPISSLALLLCSNPTTKA